MDVIITPGPLSGSISAPPSKSAGHRAVICAALADGKSRVRPLYSNDDLAATSTAISALGARLEPLEDCLSIQGITSGGVPASAIIDCGESGSTLRFFVPIAAALGVDTRFLGRGKLPARPLTPLTDALSAHGVSCSYGSDGEIVRVSGRLESGLFTLPGDVSSQYVTGLLLALPLLEGDSELRLTSPLQSRGYVEMTLQTLATFGVRIDPTESGYRIPGGQRLQARECRVEGDYSGGAFWLCAGALGEAVSVSGFQRNSLQGDRAVLDILRRFGAEVDGEETVRVAPGKLRAIQVDVTDIPDLAPVLAVVAAFAEGTTTISGAARLRIKESDRLHAVTAGLHALGAQVEAREDRLVIQGMRQLKGGVVDSFGDHRIAMAMSIAALGCRGPVTIMGAQCVSKSYPDFYEDFQRLGGICRVV